MRCDAVTVTKRPHERKQDAAKARVYVCVCVCVEGS